METATRKYPAKSRRILIDQLNNSKHRLYFLMLHFLGNRENANKAAETLFQQIGDHPEKLDLSDWEKTTTELFIKTARICRSMLMEENKDALKQVQKPDEDIFEKSEQPPACEILRILWELPTKERCSFLLRHYCSMRDEQIARVFSTDSDTAAKICAEADQIVQERISKEDPRYFGRILSPADMRRMLMTEASAVRMPKETEDRLFQALRPKAPSKSFYIIFVAAILCFFGIIGGIIYVANKPDEPAVTAEKVYAQIDIQDYGTITLELYPDAAPKTVENFVNLAKSGFYDGLTFHRIINGFMMQGGDPNGDGTGGSEETIPGEFAENGFDNELSHTRGAISMARSSDYDSASSQFFIMHDDRTSLDGKYAVFGYVIKGLNVVDNICQSAEPTDDNGTIPADQQPVITSITIYDENPLE